MRRKQDQPLLSNLRRGNSCFIEIMQAIASTKQIPPPKPHQEEQKKKTPTVLGSGNYGRKAESSKGLCGKKVRKGGCRHRFSSCLFSHWLWPLTPNLVNARRREGRGDPTGQPQKWGGGMSRQRVRRRTVDCCDQLNSSFSSTKTLFSLPAKKREAADFQFRASAGGRRKKV